MMKFKDFEIRPTTTLDGSTPRNRYELVKWKKYPSPIEVVDLVTGETKEQQHGCFVIAFLEYNEKEPCWEFRSVGLRYLEYREDGLEDYIQAYLRLLDVCRGENDEW